MIVAYITDKLVIRTSKEPQKLLRKSQMTQRKWPKIEKESWISNKFMKCITQLLKREIQIKIINTILNNSVGNINIWPGCKERRTHTNIIFTILTIHQSPC